VKTAAERSIEALTWAAVVIWLGFALVAHILNEAWLVVMMLGIILLSSAIYQRSRGWQTSLSLWVFGIWMAVFSVLEIVSQIVAAVTGSNGLGIDLWVYLGIALVSMGVAVVFRTLQGPQIGASPRASAQRGDTGYTRAGQYAAPGQVNEDLSSGYVSPTQDQYGNYGTSRGQPVQRPPQYNQQDNYGYGQQPADDAQYTQPAPRGSYQQPANDFQNAPPVSRGGRPVQQPPAPAPRERAPQSRPQRRARPAPEPNDLEARVDDIIRRSRERRGSSESGSGEDLPY
jgi:hypothetical protein